MAKNWVVRVVNTDKYYKRPVAVPTDKEHATRFAKQEVSEFIERSKIQGKGKTYLEAVHI